MIADIRPYPKMKDTGVEWLGEVPEHWEVRRVKSLSLVKRGASPRPIADPKYFDDCGEYSWVRIADVTASIRYLERTTQRLSALGQSLSVQLEPGALFLSIAGSVGKPMITRIKCCIHDGFVYFPQFNGDVEFLYRIFSSGAPFARLGKLGTQLNLNTETVGNISLGWPPSDEQTAIVRYLDHVDRRIQRYIRAKQKLIALLEEQKQAVIHQAVTGQIDVRTGRPYPAYKDSGVEWLGKVPEHWEVRRLKLLVGNVVEQGTDQRSAGVYIALENVASWTGRITTAVTESTFDSQLKRFRAEDVLFGKLRPYLAKVARPMSDGLCVGEFLVLRPRELNGAYLEQLLRSKPIIDAVNSSTFGAKMPRADWQFMGGMAVVRPPLPEQAAIVHFLDKTTSDIDIAIDGARRQIEALREYRTRLIGDVVTGKLDVRGAPAHLQDRDDEKEDERPSGRLHE